MGDRAQRIEKAYAEAEKFIECVKKVRIDAQRNGQIILAVGSKHTGALRRQSMELTRALADMRRSN